MAAGGAPSRECLRPSDRISKAQTGCKSVPTQLSIQLPEANHNPLAPYHKKSEDPFCPNFIAMAAQPAAAPEIGPLMEGNVISGKNVAATVRSEVKAEVAALKETYGKVGCRSVFLFI